MAKIPFTLDAWIKDKSQKIETRNGRPVHYIGLDRAGWQVFEVFRTNGTSEYRTYHDSYLYSGPGESTFDLFLVTPKEELTEFETALMEFVNAREPKNPMTLEGAKNNGSILLNIARKQFIKDGYVIEKKAFHDAVEKVAPEVMKEVLENVDKANEELTEFEKELESFYNHHLQVCTYDNQGTVEDSLHGGASKLIAIARKELCDQIVDHAKEAYENGKAEALKDLPRWKKLPNGIMKQVKLMKDAIIINNHYIRYSDIEKLPGFKEGER